MSNQEFVMRPRTVVCFGEPVGKMNFVLGRSWVRVCVFVVVGDSGIGRESRRDASSGPVCEVPWRRMSVELWLSGDRGGRMKGGGWVCEVVGGGEVEGVMLGGGCVVLYRRGGERDGVGNEKLSSWLRDRG